MQWGLVLLVLCGCGPSPAPPVADVHAVRGTAVTSVDAGPERFTYQPYREGESIIMESSSRVESRYGEGERDTVARHAHSKRVHVVSMKDGRIARANVHFERWEHFLAISGKDSAVGPPLAGKSFMVLVHSPGRPSIRNLDGEDVPEADDVVEGVGDLEAPAPYDTIDVRPGESAPSLANGIGTRVASTLDPRIYRPSRSSATFRRVEGDHGYFDIEMTVGPEFSDDELHYRVELTGELRISRTTGRIVHWELNGPIVRQRASGHVVLTGDER